MDLLLSRMKRMGSEQSRDRGLALACRPSDVFITTYPKCGTTWVTFICHCLRTRGDESFGEITEVVPWTIFAEDCGQDLDAEQAADPRLFKVTFLTQILATASASWIMISQFSAVARELRQGGQGRQVHLRGPRPSHCRTLLLPLPARLHACTYIPRFSATLLARIE